MADLTELFRPTDEPFRLPNAVAATIAEDASSETDTIHVVIPAHDMHQRFGPCKWMPRGSTLPSRGDSALVIFDEDNDPWIAVWWP